MVQTELWYSEGSASTTRSSHERMVGSHVGYLCEAATEALEEMEPGSPPPRHGPRTASGVKGSWGVAHGADVAVADHTLADEDGTLLQVLSVNVHVVQGMRLANGGCFVSRPNGSSSTSSVYDLRMLSA